MMKQLVYPVIACLGILGCFMFHSAPEALSAEINTYPMHDPLYPDANGTVTYTLDVEADNGVQSIELWHYIQGVAADGTITPDTNPADDKAKCWGTGPGCVPISDPWTYQHVNGYAGHSLIKYIFKVTDNTGLERIHEVSYAIQTYPPSLSSSQGGSDQPAPVYVQADVGQAMDIVFIPDKYIQSIDVFRDHCRLMIKDGIFADIFNNDMTRSLLQFFNFYINPLEGEAKEPTPPLYEYHKPPANWNQLTFAEGHALMHEKVAFRDYTIGTLFSTEQYNRGTMLHEAGHALFGLADEYRGGRHWETADLPNNWRKRKDAMFAAPQRHKTKFDVKDIVKNRAYKICDQKQDPNECQMNTAGLNITGYDLPCRDRVKFEIEASAGIP